MDYSEAGESHRVRTAHSWTTRCSISPLKRRSGVTRAIYIPDQNEEKAHVDYLVERERCLKEDTVLHPDAQRIERRIKKNIKRIDKKDR